ncbi:creatininase family protein [Piscinibacter sakaiensis]|uniref:Creatinine amidohydrolase n=1 Tax=Piscinibacter sakaiensis TaxID=1547922 RepID=A0A0K8P6I0_PISS1|nr:creatininase family protein [Piscinibacter sakaiensis]GAP38206.1 Creatinine amidohydrolase [Piscinibacter sakaiensis]
MLHGWFPENRYFPYLTSPDVAALEDKENTVILLPVAAIEQHGAHLPLAVDTAIVCGVLGQALHRLDAATPCFVLPPLCYGKSNEHIHFPGTLTLDAVTLLQTVMQLGASVYRAGFRKLAIVNSHGGQPEVMAIAARDLRIAQAGLTVFSTFLWAVPNRRQDLFPERERLGGLHAGGDETSVLLHLLPQQVKLERAQAHYAPDSGGWLAPEGGLAYAWKTDDIAPGGVLGDPFLASVEKGRELVDSMAASWVTLIREMHAFRQPTFPIRT